MLLISESVISGVLRKTSDGLILVFDSLTIFNNVVFARGFEFEVKRDLKKLPMSHFSRVIYNSQWELFTKRGSPGGGKMTIFKSHFSHDIFIQMAPLGSN